VGRKAGFGRGAPSPRKIFPHQAGRHPPQDPTALAQGQKKQSTDRLFQPVGASLTWVRGSLAWSQKTSAGKSQDAPLEGDLKTFFSVTRLTTGPSKRARPVNSVSDLMGLQLYLRGSLEIQKGETSLQKSAGGSRKVIEALRGGHRAISLPPEKKASTTAGPENGPGPWQGGLPPFFSTAPRKPFCGTPSCRKKAPCGDFPPTKRQKARFAAVGLGTTPKLDPQRVGRGTNNQGGGAQGAAAKLRAEGRHLITLAKEGGGGKAGKGLGRPRPRRAHGGGYIFSDKARLGHLPVFDPRGRQGGKALRERRTGWLPENRGFNSQRCPRFAGRQIGPRGGLGGPFFFRGAGGV